MLDNISPLMFGVVHTPEGVVQSMEGEVAPSTGVDSSPVQHSSADPSSPPPEETFHSILQPLIIALHPLEMRFARLADIYCSQGRLSPEDNSFLLAFIRDGSHDVLFRYLFFLFDVWHKKFVSTAFRTRESFNTVATLMLMTVRSLAVLCDDVCKGWSLQHRRLLVPLLHMASTYSMVFPLVCSLLEEITTCQGE